MVEEEPCHLTSQAALELTRLNEVEGFIQWKATNLSMGDPMLAEDLAQQAREVVIRRLRVFPDCPYSHLVNKARDAIFRYRQKGNSVDGLLYQRRRARQYQITSFEESIDREAKSSERAATLSEVLSDPRQPRRLTEERAMIGVLLDTVRDHLSPKGNSALTLRLSGFTWKEIRHVLNLNHWEMRVIQKDLAQLFQRVWG